MACDMYEMTVFKSPVLSNSKHPNDEQREKSIHHTKSDSSAKGSIVVCKPQKSSIQSCLEIDNGLIGIHSTPPNYLLWLYIASLMGSVRSLDPIQPTQWRSSIAELRQSASWLWNLPHCIIIGRNGVYVR